MVQVVLFFIRAKSVFMDAVPPCDVGMLHKQQLAVCNLEEPQPYSVVLLKCNGDTVLVAMLLLLRVNLALVQVRWTCGVFLDRCLHIIQFDVQW